MHNLYIAVCKYNICVNSNHVPCAIVYLIKYNLSVVHDRCLSLFIYILLLARIKLLIGHFDFIFAFLSHINKNIYDESSSQKTQSAAIVAKSSESTLARVFSAYKSRADQ